MLLNRAGQADLSAGRVGELAQPAGSVRFDWAVVALSSWFLGGAYLDGWAHNHGRVDNTFFTPWHGLLYSGFFAVAILLGLTLIRNMARGYPWMRALPVGFEQALVGVPLFAFGGAFDLVWHQLFGFEVGVEPLLSPSHLILAFGMALIMSAPLRAAWRRADSPAAGLFAQLPMLLSLTFLLSLITFMTQFAHPLVNVWARSTRFDDVGRALGVTGVMLQTGFLIGAVLVGLRRWALPPGSLTLIFSLNAFLVTTQHDQYFLLPAVVLAGVVADLLLWRLKPSAERPVALRLFAFAAPVIIYTFYFMTIKLSGTLLWSTNLWTGAVALAGLVGLLLSYVLVPPPGDRS
jgi:hypothetical protein